MIRNAREWIFRYLFPSLFLFIIISPATSVQAEPTLGKKYDQTNYQEIADYLMPPLLNWVRKGEFVLQTEKLEFEMRKSPAFLEASQKNEGKYDIDKDDLLIEKSTGKPPKFIYGYPFPKLDLKDPKIAEKIMENQAAIRFNLGIFYSTSRLIWIGRGGIERHLITGNSSINYQQSRRGPIPNPNNFLSQGMSFAIEPMSLRGISSMIWSYNDLREDTAFSYIAPLRKLVRVSVSETSNPFQGSDFSPDDMYGWAGKNRSMKWKLVGEKILLVPFTSSKKIEVQELPDGTIDRLFATVKKGYEIPGWKGAPWGLIDLIWVPRPVWLIEMYSKYSNYNYGRQILYVDKETYVSYFKEIYERSGPYWKTSLVGGNYQVTPTGQDLIGTVDFYLSVDDKTHHATITEQIKYPSREHRMNLPLTILGPNQFTEAALIQLSK